MFSQIFLQSIFLAITFSSLEGEECFHDGTSWSDEFLQEITLHIPTASACLDVCTNTAACVAFTWKKQLWYNELAESCWTFSDIGEPEACKECISGQLANCQLCSQHFGCQIGENLIATVQVLSEIECKIKCADTAGCGYYTWFESSTTFKKICYLLSSCGDTVDCSNCMSGPPLCPYCKGMEYNELDDPTRNINHGKYISLAYDKVDIVKNKYYKLNFPPHFFR